MSSADDKQGSAAPLTEQERARAAHQLNNALAVILGNAQVALADAQQSPKLLANLKEIVAAGQRARDLIRAVLTLPAPSTSQSGTDPLSIDELRHAANLHSAGMRILYIDDEEALVMLAKRHLKRLGYDVVGATGANEALEVFARAPHSFAAVMTDLNMPGMSGLLLAKELLKARPDLPIIVASGFVTEELRAEAARVGVRNVVYKPGTVEELTQLIHTLLTKPTE